MAMVARKPHPVKTLSGHESPVRLIVFGPGDLMVTADTNMQVCVWKGDEVVTRMDHRASNLRHRALDRLRSAVFTKDGSALFLACGSRLLSVDSFSGEVKWRYVAPEWWPFLIASPQSLALDSNDGLVVAFDNGTFERYSPSMERLYRRKDNDSPVWITLDEAADKIIGCDGYRIGMWSLKDGHKTNGITISDHAFAFAYSPETGLAAVRDTGTVALWSLLGSEVQERVPVPPGPPLLCFDADGQNFAFCSGDEVVVRNLSGESIHLPCGEESRLVTFSFGPDGSLWTGHADGAVRRWEL